MAHMVTGLLLVSQGPVGLSVVFTDEQPVGSWGQQAHEIP